LEIEESRSLLSELDDLKWASILLNFGFFFVMAMEISFGKRSPKTKAWTIVYTRRVDTVKVEIAERQIERDRVIMFVTAIVYFIVAMDAPVIGNV
jgi:hypothetical protein